MKMTRLFAVLFGLLALSALSPTALADSGPPKSYLSDQLKAPEAPTDQTPPTSAMVIKLDSDILLPTPAPTLGRPQGNDGPPGLSTFTLISFDGKVSQVVAQRVGTLTNVFGKGFTLDVHVFGGFSLTDKGLVGGGSITKRFKAADQLDIVVGGFVQANAKDRITSGLVLGASLHFKT